MKIKQLAKLLGTKNQDEDVEFVICTKTGIIVCMEMEANATDIVNVLKHLPQKPETTKR